VALRYYHAGMKIISVKLPESLARWLEQESAASRRSRSEIIREALEQRRQGTGEPTVADVLADLVGTIDGPKDLSTNPRHLDGLGG
jgi:hypothetical protein